MWARLSFACRGGGSRCERCRTPVSHPQKRRRPRRESHPSHREFGTNATTWISPNVTIELCSKRGAARPKGISLLPDGTLCKSLRCRWLTTAYQPSKDEGAARQTVGVRGESKLFSSSNANQGNTVRQAVVDSSTGTGQEKRYRDRRRRGDPVPHRVPHPSGSSAEASRKDYEASVLPAVPRGTESALEKYYKKAMLRAMSRGNISSFFQHFREFEAKFPAKISIFHYNLLISAYASRGDVEGAKSAWREVRERFGQEDHGTYKALLRLFAAAGEAEEALQVLKLVNDRKMSLEKRMVDWIFGALEKDLRASLQLEKRKHADASIALGISSLLRLNSSTTTTSSRVGNVSASQSSAGTASLDAEVVHERAWSIAERLDETALEQSERVRARDNERRRRKKAFDRRRERDTDLAAGGGAHGKRRSWAESARLVDEVLVELELSMLRDETITVAPRVLGPILALLEQKKDWRLKEKLSTLVSSGATENFSLSQTLRGKEFKGEDRKNRGSFYECTEHRNIPGSTASRRASCSRGSDTGAVMLPWKKPQTVKGPLRVNGLQGANTKAAGGAHGPEYVDSGPDDDLSATSSRTRTRPGLSLEKLCEMSGEDKEHNGQSQSEDNSMKNEDVHKLGTAQLERDSEGVKEGQMNESLTTSHINLGKGSNHEIIFADQLLLTSESASTTDVDECMRWWQNSGRKPNPASAVKFLIDKFDRELSFVLGLEEKLRCGDGSSATEVRLDDLHSVLHGERFLVDQAARRAIELVVSLTDSVVPATDESSHEENSILDVQTFNKVLALSILGNQGERVWSILDLMRYRDVTPDLDTAFWVIQACTSNRDHERVKSVLRQSARHTSAEENAKAARLLLQFYCQVGDLNAAETALKTLAGCQKTNQNVCKRRQTLDPTSLTSTYLELTAREQSLLSSCNMVLEAMAERGDVHRVIGLLLEMSGGKLEQLFRTGHKSSFGKSSDVSSKQRVTQSSNFESLVDSKGRGQLGVSNDMALPEPDIHSFNWLIRSCCMGPELNVDLAESVAAYLAEAGIGFNEDTYIFLLDVFAADFDVEKVMLLAELIAQQEASLFDCPRLTSALLHAFHEVGALGEAEALVEKLIGRSIQQAQPPRETFGDAAVNPVCDSSAVSPHLRPTHLNSLLSIYVDRQETEKAEHLWREMESAKWNVGPTIETLNEMTRLYCSLARQGRDLTHIAEKVRLLFTRMGAIGVKPNTETYTLLREMMPTRAELKSNHS